MRALRRRGLRRMPPGRTRRSGWTVDHLREPAHEVVHVPALTEPGSAPTHGGSGGGVTCSYVPLFCGGSGLVVRDVAEQLLRRFAQRVGVPDAGMLDAERVGNGDSGLLEGHVIDGDGVLPAVVPLLLAPRQQVAPEVRPRLRHRDGDAVVVAAGVDAVAVALLADLALSRGRSRGSTSLRVPACASWAR